MPFKMYPPPPNINRVSDRKGAELQECVVNASRFILEKQRGGWFSKTEHFHSFCFTFAEEFDHIKTDHWVLKIQKRQDLSH